MRVQEGFRRIRINDSYECGYCHNYNFESSGDRFSNSFNIGTDYYINDSLNLNDPISEIMTSDPITFKINKVSPKFIPEILKRDPSKSKVGAGLNCGVIWTLCKGLKKDAVVLCQDKDKDYHACKIISNYYYPYSSYYTCSKFF